MPQPANQFSAGLNLAYELDLGGRLLHERNAAALDVRAREQLLADARLLVQANVARGYLALRALDTERDIVRDTVAAYGETLSLTEKRARAGDVADLDLARVRAELAANEAEALALDRRRVELETALAVLVGEAPSNFSLKPTTWTTGPACRAGWPAQRAAATPPRPRGGAQPARSRPGPRRQGPRRLVAQPVSDGPGWRRVERAVQSAQERRQHLGRWPFGSIAPLRRRPP